MSITAARTSPPIDTRDKILDAAELLFVERGFAATSMRAIASKAEVNLAAANYHFGSKRGLLSAVFHRRVAPITEQRLAGLKQLKESGKALTVRGILEVFFQPMTSSENNTIVPGVVGWIYGEQEAITKPILESEFAETTAAFQEALKPLLAKVSREELGWRFHFIIGAMIHLLRINAPLGVASSRESFDTGLQRLVDFAVASLSQANTGMPND